jgi:site-specific DNA-methyltransferase (adenine-specific)
VSPIDLRLGRWQDALADVTTCDAVICDPPYSARTHEGHDASAAVPGGRWTDTKGKEHAARAPRRGLNYNTWTPDDVRSFVDSMAPRCAGWFVAFTSHDLVSAYSDALEAHGRYVFAPLPFFSPGSRVRLSGDGPSSWTCWIVVARPRHAPYSKWGTLPGGYMVPPERCEVVGGKPLALMAAIIRDYSRPGDLIVDPFCGSSTTALAAAMEGRRCITSEEKPEHYAIAKRRLDRGYQPGLI